MFDWFKSREERLKDYNVVKFPGAVSPPPSPPPTVEEDATPYYTIGHTNNNRVFFKMGYSTLTMNKEGVHNLIKQLELFADQLDEDTTND